MPGSSSQSVQIQPKLAFISQQVHTKSNPTPIGYVTFAMVGQIIPPQPPERISQKPEIIDMAQNTGVAPIGSLPNLNLIKLT